MATRRDPTARCALALALAVAVCAGACQSEPRDDHGPIADGVTAALGQPLPDLSAEHMQWFQRGRAVALRRFRIDQGLGPALNVAFCAACHEKPAIGGSAGLYRNFTLVGVELDGAFFATNAISLFDCGLEQVDPDERERHPPIESSYAAVNGVLRIYGYGDGRSARPPEVGPVTVSAQRNPIPFFGVGLLAELSEEEILRRADPDDRDGDGISGRPNYDRAFVGRFGRKAQTVSIEGFIRGPLYNHLGITSDPLTEAQRARLPVDSRDPQRMAALPLAQMISAQAQAAAPSTPNCDVDPVMDPELSPDDLFDLVAFAMLLAAPQPRELGEREREGLKIFDRLSCDRCHTPRIEGPRGALAVYSDLLLHDMGEELSDGIRMGVATGSEFRTQPLWGIAAVGPYLHDGRAATLDAAIRWHGGEARSAREAYEALEVEEREALWTFLESLGGADQRSPGLIAAGASAPEPGALGGARAGVTEGEQEAFAKGRALFDREFAIADGLGNPRFNGDSCRACHFEPEIGGAGPRGVNVVRHGIVTGSQHFAVPVVGTVLHRLTTVLESYVAPQAGVTVFEHRQTPPLFGLGLIETIPESEIVGRADPDDADGDGVSGRVSRTDRGELGRFGWKAQVSTLAEFVRDAVATEMGMTLPDEPGLSLGKIHDNDGVADPEISPEYADSVLAFTRLLAAPSRSAAADPIRAQLGEEHFVSFGCARCHVPELDSPGGKVALYSDLLLHEILPVDAFGIEERSASMREFRTAPYLHSGAADTLDQAIRLHDGEAIQARDAYIQAPADERSALLLFLETL